MLPLAIAYEEHKVAEYCRLMCPERHTLAYDRHAVITGALHIGYISKLIIRAPCSSTTLFITYRLVLVATCITLMCVCWQNTVCTDGQVCGLKEVTCIQAPCYPIPECSTPNSFGKTN